MSVPDAGGESSSSPGQYGRRIKPPRRGLLLLNPAVMYAMTWMFVLLLYSFELSNLLDPLRLATIILVAGSSLAFLGGWLFESLLSRHGIAHMRLDLNSIRSQLGSGALGKRLRIAWRIFGAGILFEIIFFRGAPGLGLIGIGPEILYTDFGIPGLHGLFNSMFYACCVIQLARILLGVSKGKAFLICVSLAYPVLGMSRQVLISLLLQYLFVYFSIKRPSAAVFARAGIIFVTIFLLFGYLGDIRSGREHIIALASPSFEYPDWLPSAFIWFYIYLCTPLNNVNFNIDIVPNGLPLETAGTLIPSFARDAFFNAAGGSKEWALVTDSFNVSSLLQSLLTDFGIVGTITFTLICGILFSRLMRRSATSPTAFFTTIILLHGIALSFSANLLFHLVFMFEIFTVLWIVAKRRRRE